MAQALYRKWRPQTFDDIVGQEHIVQTLRHALRTGHTHHAYLLAGPRGVGKTTTARLIAKAVNCLAETDQRPCGECEICQAVMQGRLMDLVEIDAASNTGVDNIRELLEKVGFRPTQAAYKVYVIDEVHMLSTAAFNALLKTLEEPPEHVIFVLATTEVHRIPETILSRCQRFEFRRIPLALLVKRLQAIADSEGIQVESEAYDLIARAATGSMRDAISLFDQMASVGDITADYVRSMLGAEKRTVIRNVLQAWIDDDLNKGLQEINRAVDGGADPRQLARQTADFMRGLLLMRIGAGDTWQDPTEEERHAFEQMARDIDPGRLAEAIRLFSEVASQRRTGWQPQLPLELAFVQATLPQTAIAQVTNAPQAVQAQPRSTPTRTSEPVSRPAQHEDAAPAIIAAPVSKQSASRPEPRRSEARAMPQKESQPEQDTATDIASSGGIDGEFIAKLQSAWLKVIGAMQPRSLGALLRDAQVAGADREGRIVLAFQHEFHRNKVDDAEYRRKVEEALSVIVKQKISLRCVMEGTWKPDAHPSPAATTTPRKAKTPLPPDPVEDLVEPEAPPDDLDVAPSDEDEEDELVRMAREQLGAQARVLDDAE